MQNYGTIDNRENNYGT